jgi:ribosomal protein L4
LTGKILLVAGAEQDLLRRAARNLKHLMVLDAESINVRDLLLHEKLLIARRDLARLQEIWT